MAKGDWTHTMRERHIESRVATLEYLALAGRFRFVAKLERDNLLERLSELSETSPDTPGIENWIRRLERLGEDNAQQSD